MSGDLIELTIDESIKIINLKKKIAYERNIYWFLVNICEDNKLLDNFTRLDASIRLNNDYDIVLATVLNDANFELIPNKWEKDLETYFNL